MPERYGPKNKDYPLSRLNQGGMQLVRVHCRYCKRTHNYFPDDLIQIFGDVDVDSLMDRMRCEAGDLAGWMCTHSRQPAARLSVCASGA